jgi:hypothetical protein
VTTRKEGRKRSEPNRTDAPDPDEENPDDEDGRG